MQAIASILLEARLVSEETRWVVEGRGLVESTYVESRMRNVFSVCIRSPVQPCAISGILQLLH